METIGKTVHLQLLEVGEVEKSGRRQPQEAGFGNAGFEIYTQILRLMALWTHILRLLGPKTLLYKAFGLF